MQPTLFDQSPMPRHRTTDPETSRQAAAQQRWLDWLSKSSAVEVYVWRPSDLDDLDRILR